MDGWLINLTRVAAVSIGLMAGMFWIFSVAIMPALDQLESDDGLRAMKKINDVIQNPLFLIVFLAAGLTGGALAVTSIWTWDQPGAGYRLAGGLLAFLGSLVLTVVYHIPRNDDLDAAVVGTTEGAAEWARYLREWVPWNHVRTVASTGSFITLLLALSA